MKVAILGAAHQHVDYALAEVAHRDELELVAASEPDPKLRERFLSGLSAPLYDTPQQLLEAHDVDVALITGIYNQRAEAAVAALRAGAHVLADKPLCTSLTQLETIREAAVDAERHVSIVFEKRFYPATLALRRLLSGGVLGNIAMVAATGPHKLNQPTRPAWFLDPATYGGIAGDLPIHDIDLVLDLIGEQQGTAPVGTVSAHVGNARADDHPGFDDHVALLMLAGDVPATIEANWLGPEAADVHGHYRMRVTGSLGTAEVDWAYHRLTVTTHDRETWDEPLGPAQRPAQYFFDALLAGEQPEITTAASLRATEIALKAQFSAGKGGAPQHF
ncbi:Gfo/Idh/MocA family protein [Brachybacterium fresconis]|uniref:Dehydrogenase n=1 Tax=Brachybacterium fresconis TaxID=173363 RepID=A0ABS4YQX7_9MICO|nr:Gfo/Idh/MocA family oxidoreductase [Brachybacterium fresconis]MBP2411197.1 putative dehydrogenase [Brachybacterium fresconis]